MDSLQKLCSSLEPILRRVVRHLASHYFLLYTFLFDMLIFLVWGTGVMHSTKLFPFYSNWKPFLHITSISEVMSSDMLFENAGVFEVLP